MTEQERSEMLSKMDIRKLLHKLAIPAIAAMIFNALYNLIDTFFVARGVGEVAIGALSIAYPVHMIVLSTGLMVGIGSASVFSRAYGRGDKTSMRRAVAHALVLNLVFSLSITLLAYFFMEDLLRLFGAREGDLLRYAEEYLSIILIALLPFSLSITFHHLTRAEGRAKIAMISLVIGAVLNIILDPLFIFDFGLGLGVRGAAWATAAGKTASCVYILIQAHRPESALAIHIPSILSMKPKMIAEILAVGLPSFVRVSLGGLIVILVNNLINFHAPAGTAALYIAIYGVINRLIRFSLMPGHGLVQGMIPIVGFSYGAKYFQRLQDVMGYASKLLLTYFTVVLLLIMVFATQLFSLFSPEEDIFFINEGARAFRIVALGFSFVTFQVILSSAYQAMGRPFRAFLVALSRRFLVFIPFAFVLTHFLGVEGIWWTFFVADFVTGTLSFLAYRYEVRSLQKWKQQGESLA